MKLQPENLAGIISLAGSTGLMLSGESSGISSAIMFTAAELTLAKAGHKIAGYSAAGALFAAGDLMLAFSERAQNAPAMQVMLLGMTGFWALGAARYPLHVLAEKTKNSRLKKFTETTIPAIVGTGNLSLRVPGAVTAAQSGNWLIAGAITCWLIADVLAGRLHEQFSKAARFVKSKTQNKPSIQGPDLDL